MFSPSLGWPLFTGLTVFDSGRLRYRFYDLLFLKKKIGGIILL